MSNFKRVLSFAIAAVMAFGIMVPAFAAKLPEDVVGTKYEESVELLQALGIMIGDKDTGDFRLEDTIRRSEVAKIAVNMAGLSEVAESANDKSVFPDVVEGHWATGYINVATAQKYVIGDDNGNFRPDDKITFAEAVTILTRVLGYEPSAQANGGFPTGYLVVAGNNGMLKGGISASNDSSALRGTVAMMGYNALTINLMERTGYGKDEFYEIVDKTLLTDKLDVTKYMGQLVANDQSSLSGSSSLKANEVQIKVGDKVEVYTAEGIDTTDLLARNIVFYVRETESTGDLDIILMRNDSNKNQEVEIKASNLEGLKGEDGQKKTLSYWINKKTDKKVTEATITADAKIFYNGVATTSYDLTDILNMTSGHVTLLDTERSDEYNHVFVTEYKNMVVDEVSTVSNKISDKYNLLSLTLDPKDKNLKFAIWKDGEAIGIEDIKEWDILSVAMNGKTPSESSVINVYVSDNSVTGKITEVTDDKFVINDKEYEVAANYTEAGQPALGLNDEGIFYLDVENKIAAVDTETRAGSNYAYLAKANVTTSIDKTLQLQLFETNGETNVVNGAEKIKVNSQVGLTAEKALEAIKAANNGEATQLITYEKNAKGEIYYINTATDNTSTSNPLKNSFSLDFKGDNVKYSATSRKLGQFNVNSSTVVLDIPAGATDPDDFTVRTIDMFIDKSEYNVEIYDLSEDLTAKVVIVKNVDAIVNAEAPVAVVDKIASVQNEDSMTVHKLYAYQNGEKIEILAKDASTLVKGEEGQEKRLEAGDIIQFQTNAKGEIDKINVLFDSADRNNDEVNVVTDHEGTEMTTIIGRVNKKFATSINIKANNAPEMNLDISKAKVYSYDYSKALSAQVSLVDASYITRYDDADPQKLFVRLYKGEVTEIVIIQEQ